MLSLEGKQLGNYDVIRRIRVGGMGAVYEGRQRTAFDRRVAIKVILGDYARDRDMRRRFAREARTIARLHHPHILQLIEFGDEQGILYLVMPFIDGGTLTSYLRRKLPELGEVSMLYQQLLDAVEHAHEHGLIHRDIKSSNVLLELRRNTVPYLYLADFGLVRTMRPDESSNAGKPIPLEQVPGTPHYMAPEQTMGIVTPLTDIYALGVLLYQMLTGNLPYNDPDEVRVIQMHLNDPIPVPSEYDASIPTELDDVVRTAMAKHPAERYQNIMELRQAFLAAIEGPVQITNSQESEAITPPSPPPMPSPRTTRQLRMTRQLSPDARRPIEPPKPIIMQPPTPAELPSIAVHDPRQRLERADKVRITDTARQKPRGIVTEDRPQTPPTQPRRGNIVLPLIAAFVAIILIALLLLSHLFGMNQLLHTLPFSTSPTDATVTITVQSKTIQNSFLLTAAPQTKAPNLATHAIPDRVIQVEQTASNTVNTTGTQQTPGIRAQGTVTLVNNGNNQVTVTKGQDFSTTDGIHFQSMSQVTVPPKQGEQPGTQDIVLIADQTGLVGNIPASAINGLCCNNALYATNAQAFAGGENAQTTHYIAQGDIDSTQEMLEQNLKQQLAQQLQKQLASDEVTAGQPVYRVISATSNQPVNTPASTVQVNVKMQGSISVYRKNVADQTAMVLLNQQAQQALGTGYQLQSSPTLVGSETTQLGKNGIIFVKVTVRGTWSYNLTNDQINSLRAPIQGATTDAAIAYLKSQAGIADVSIRLPFGSNHLPTSPNNIMIVITHSPS
ncbi:MAG TPA: protein kinase [Dictyobacter sp.]|jgi:serine/threonine protein kinase|nr:protein kinase [Dictyobacter sp.]